MITNTFSLNFTSTEIENERTFGEGGGVLENKQGWTRGEEGVKTRESWANVVFEGPPVAVVRNFTLMNVRSNLR